MPYRISRATRAWVRARDGVDAWWDDLVCSRRLRRERPRVPRWAGDALAAYARWERGLARRERRQRRGADLRVGVQGFLARREARLWARSAGGVGRARRAGERTAAVLLRGLAALAGVLVVLRSLAVRPTASSRVRTLVGAAMAAVVVAGFALVVTGVPGSGPPRQDMGVVGIAEAARAGAGALTGPGVTRPGIHVTVSPESSGALQVVEQVRSDRALDALPLDAPPALAGGEDVRLVDVRVTVDGQRVAGPDEVDDERDVALPSATRAVELSYRVVGADRRSPTAPPRRASLSLRPASAEALGSAPTVVEVRDVTVHTLVCVDEPRSRQLCGVDAARGWRTEPVPADASSVVALVDLPSQRAPSTY